MVVNKEDMQDEDSRVIHSDQVEKRGWDPRWVGPVFLILVSVIVVQATLSKGKSDYLRVHTIPSAPDSPVADNQFATGVLPPAPAPAPPADDSSQSVSDDTVPNDTPDSTQVHSGIVPVELIGKKVRLSYGPYRFSFTFQPGDKVVISNTGGPYSYEPYLAKVKSGPNGEMVFEQPTKSSSDVSAALVYTAKMKYGTFVLYTKIRVTDAHGITYVKFLPMLSTS